MGMISSDTHTDMISGEEVRNLFPDTVPAPLRRQVCAGSGTVQGTLLAPGQQKVQAVGATLAQKGKCPRMSLHSLPNRIRVRGQQRLLLGTVSTGLGGGRSRQPGSPPRRLGSGSGREERHLSHSSIERSSCVFNMKHFIR